MDRKRIMVLMHKGLIPPEKVDEKTMDWVSCEWITEYSVLKTLKKLKHDVLPIDVFSDLSKIRKNQSNDILDE